MTTEGACVRAAIAKVHTIGVTVASIGPCFATESFTASSLSVTATAFRGICLFASAGFLTDFYALFAPAIGAAARYERANVLFTLAAIATGHLRCGATILGSCWRRIITAFFSFSTDGVISQGHPNNREREVGAMAAHQCGIGRIHKGELGPGPPSVRTQEEPDQGFVFSREIFVIREINGDWRQKRLTVWSQCISMADGDESRRQNRRVRKSRNADGCI